jgi:superoxide dismutase, Fe-Mn family
MQGSGWVWLIDRDGNLEVISSHNNFSPEATDASITSIMCLDAWEHSYWFDYGAKKEVSKNFINSTNPVLNLILNFTDFIFIFLPGLC